MNALDLHKPFAPDRISWRVGATNQEKTKGMALAYIDARDVMQRLDEVCGPFWQAEYIPMPNGTCCCRIGILIGDQWIWRSNGAMTVPDNDKPDNREMAEKGSYSDAFKRAAVLWGIGRYLYDLDSPWVALEPAGRSYKIAANEYPKLARLLGNTKVHMPAAPAVIEAVPTGKYAIMLPKQERPYAAYDTEELWVMEMNDMIGKIRDSEKLSVEGKEKKMKDLEEANRHVIDALPEELRNGLML